MMERNTRDLYVRQDEELLTLALDRADVLGGLRAFLETVVTTGILVEREIEQYSFAHLTLQEHLASLHVERHGLVSVLAGAVDDDWWRETTLLYAARNDPSPIVDAALADGRVRALSLAFDCAEESHRLPTATAERLEQFRQDALREPAGSELHRLLAGITISQYLHQALRLDNNTTITTRPVPADIYRLFCAEQGEQMPPGTDTLGPGAPARGMTRQQARAFVMWLNTVLPGATYRLPTRDDLTDPDCPLRDRYVWHLAPESGHDPVLFVPQGATHPFGALPLDPDHHDPYVAAFLRLGNQQHRDLVGAGPYTFDQAVVNAGIDLSDLCEALMPAAEVNAELVPVVNGLASRSVERYTGPGRHPAVRLLAETGEHLTRAIAVAAETRSDDGCSPRLTLDRARQVLPSAEAVLHSYSALPAALRLITVPAAGTTGLLTALDIAGRHMAAARRQLTARVARLREDLGTAERFTHAAYHDEHVGLRLRVARLTAAVADTLPLPISSDASRPPEHAGAHAATAGDLPAVAHALREILPGIRVVYPEEIATALETATISRAHSEPHDPIRPPRRLDPAVAELAACAARLSGQRNPHWWSDDPATLVALQAAALVLAAASSRQPGSDRTTQLYVTAATGLAAQRQLLAGALPTLTGNLAVARD